MRGPPCIALLLGTLLLLQNAVAQTVVNSTYVGPSYGNYGAAKNWTPAEVPNNTGAKNYNVTIPPTISVTVDADATISNLTLGSFLNIFGKTFAVAGTTFSPADQTPNINLTSTTDVPATFNAGILPAFSGNTLKGRYIIGSGGAPAMLQFKGANVVSLGEGELNLFGAFARVVDEYGSDALRNLARIESDAVLRVDGRNLAISVPFTNNGILHLGGSNATIFTAAYSVTNFDSGTRTLSGGTFVLDQIVGEQGNLPVELRFDGADIVNNGSTIELHGATSTIADLAGNDALRNLARNLPGASLTLRDHDFATAGRFGNEGLLLVTRSTFLVAGPFTNFDAATRTLSGGTFEVTDSQLKFSDADIVHNAAAITLTRSGIITDIGGNNGLRNFSDNLSAGGFVLNQKNFTTPGNFANAGTIETGSAFFGIRQETPPGTFTVPAGFSYTQTAGSTVNNGVLTADRIDILGGVLVGGRGTIHGDVTVTNGTLTPSFQTILDGKLTLNSGSHFHYLVEGDDVLTGSRPAISGKVVLAGTLDIDNTDQFFLSTSAALTVIKSKLPLTGAFDNAPNGARILSLNGRSSFVVIYESNRVLLTQFHAEPPPAQLLNISSRAFLSRAGDDPFGDRAALIGGFIISGNESKKVGLRGIGPSLSKFGVSPALADPTLELHDSSGGVIARSDNWKDTQPGEITQSGLAPGDDREAAIIATLAPGSYTVVLQEKNGLAGNGLVEVYDLSKSSNSKLANISTRGYTDSSNVLIGGVIVAGDGPANDDVVVRAIGPQLRRNGIFNAIEDPTLELRDNNGGLVAFNDDWSTNYEQLAYTELAPFNGTESAMRVSLPRGNYTAIVRAKGNSGGVALVEFYDLRR
jgi:hypothetical protein